MQGHPTDTQDDGAVAQPSPAEHKIQDASTGSPPNLERQFANLSNLLGNLEDRRSNPSEENAHQDRLTRARLGLASSLFTALRAKHPRTANHCLRVALGCSAWAMQLGVPPGECDEIEIAALLHDIGKIGVSDHVLMKASRLDGEEVLLMDRHRHIGLEILKSCAPSRRLLELVYYAGAWYDGRKVEFKVKGDEIPAGARMISIVDAFDSMTTEHVYRKAMSRERAMAELFECAGSQFDPRMVTEFCNFVSTDRVRLESSVARRWLQDLDQRSANMIWQLNTYNRTDFENTEEEDGLNAYHRRAIEDLQDGVVHIDNNLRVLHWNHGAERITGIGADSVVDTLFDPTVLRMRDEQGNFILAENCPIKDTLATASHSLRRVTISGQRQKVQVSVYLVPVLSLSGAVRGVSMLLRDVSSESSLEERIQSLSQRATMDPLTGVANRAEFDRVFDQLLAQNVTNNTPCSLILCDIDHFKRINDTFGHQAGDDVLVQFSSLLKRAVRSGDMVARYGGEEFCILCAECDNASATRQAEKIRQGLESLPQAALNSECITASFGVTQMQAGDSPDSMLRRADRALYQAKDAGRNCVVQLGSGFVEKTESVPEGWFARFRKQAPEFELNRTLIARAPLSVTAEKLKGYVADHNAEIVTVEQNRAALKIEAHNTPLTRRMSDRTMPFLIDLEFQETRVAGEKENTGSMLQTSISVTVRPGRKRDRRRRDVEERAKQIFFGLKSYFMAHEVTSAS